MGTDTHHMDPRRSRHGVALIWMLGALLALLAMASMTVDFGHVQLVKTQLNRAADAAARYAAAGVSSGNAVAWAQIAAADNIVNGSAAVLQAGDVQTGNWSNGTFTAGGSPSNAVRISMACDATHQNRIPLLFGQVVGQRYCNVTASAVAVYTNVPDGAFVGYSSVTVKNNTLFASYNSAVDPNPTPANYKVAGMVASNGPIDGKNNTSIKGGVTVGPSGSNDIPYSGALTTETLIPPTLPLWSPGTNPGGIASTYSVNGNTTLTGGTYWFTELSVSGTLTFDGPATLYVNGNADITGTLQAYNSIPSNLRVYQYGANVFGDPAGSANNITIVADVWAPNATLAANNNLQFQGRGFFNVIDVKNNASFFYDETLGAPVGGKSITTVR